MSLWGLNLFTQFHDALSFDLQELLLSADLSCFAPNLSTLTTCSSQLAALHSIRVAAVRHFIFIPRAQEKRMAKTVNQKLKQSPTALAAPMFVTAAAAPFSSPTPPVHSVPSSQLSLEVLSLPLNKRCKVDCFVKCLAAKKR
jgi:hypothetical protein